MAARSCGSPTAAPTAASPWNSRPPEAGKYALNLYYCTSWDYAIVQAWLDGEKLGEPLDNYSPSVAWRGKAALGTRTLAAGKHRLRLQCVGRNEQSKGYYMGLDAVELRRER